jgi:hypothetical protein
MDMWIAVGIGCINALLLVVLLRRSGSDHREEAQLQAQAQALALQQSMLNVQEKLERVERELRFEITESSDGKS